MKIAEQTDDAMMQGLAATIDGLLPDGRAFYLLTFDASEWGQYHGIGNCDRATTVANLRAAADALEKRERAAQGKAA